MTEYQVYIGDSQVELKKFPKGRQFKCCVTSPPYNIGKKYRGYEDTKTELQYQLIMRNIFSEVHRLLTDDGLLFLNIADEAANWHRSHDILKIVTQSIPFIPVHRVIWKKPHVQALATKKQIGFAHEFIFVLAKTNKYKLKHYIENDVWEFYKKKEWWETHPAVFPLELPRRCISLCCEPGDWALDPFGGSGTTLLAAREAGINGAIVEFSAENIPLIKRKLRWGQTLRGGEHMIIYEGSNIIDEITMPELKPTIDLSWIPETDKVEFEEFKRGLDKYA